MSSTLIISEVYGGFGEIRVELDDERDRIPKLIKLELSNQNGQILDTLYLQLEISKGEQGTSKEVMDRLANRDAPLPG